MAAVTDIFLLVIIGVILYILGRQYKDYTTGILGGFMIFLLGVAVLVNPMSSVSSLTNILTGSVLLGVGAYIWINGSIELLKQYVV